MYQPLVYDVDPKTYMSLDELIAGKNHFILLSQAHDSKQRRIWWCDVVATLGVFVCSGVTSVAGFEKITSTNVNVGLSCAVFVLNGILSLIISPIKSETQQEKTRLETIIANFRNRELTGPWN